MQVFERAQKLGSIEATPPFVELAFALQMVEEFPAIHFANAISRGYHSPAHTLYLPNDITRYSLSGVWNENLRGTMNGLFTSASTVRSARMWVISPGRDAMFALRMVLSAYIRWVSFLRTCMTLPNEPLPIRLSKSNCSIVSDSWRAGLKSILRWNAPEPAVALYH